MNLITALQSLRIVLGEAKTTNDCDVTAAFGDTTVPFKLGAQQSVTNGVTPVTVVAAPGVNIGRQVKEVRLHNNDTVAHTVTLQFNNNGTISILDGPVTVQPGGNYLYTPAATSGTGALSSWQRISVASIAGAASSGTIALPGGYRRYRVTIQGLTVGTNGGQMQMLLSTNGGSTFLASYTWQGMTLAGATVSGVSSSLTSIALSPPMNTAGTGDFEFEIYPGGNGTAVVRGTLSAFANTGPAWNEGLYHGLSAGPVNAMQVNVSAGVYTGSIILDGML